MTQIKGRLHRGVVIIEGDIGKQQTAIDAVETAINNFTTSWDLLVVLSGLVFSSTSPLAMPRHTIAPVPESTRLQLSWAVGLVPDLLWQRE